MSAWCLTDGCIVYEKYICNFSSCSYFSIMGGDLETHLMANVLGAANGALEPTRYSYFSKAEESNSLG